jgi:hypothetical protein
MHSAQSRGPRKLRSRPPPSITPVYVSQLTVEALVGINPRRYLDLLAAHPNVTRAEVGKLRVVALEDLRALLARLSDTSTAEKPSSDVDDEPAASTDDVLAQLGVRRVR